MFLSAPDHDTPLERVRFSTRIRNALELGGLKIVSEVRTAADAVLLSFQGRAAAQYSTFAKHWDRAEGNNQPESGGGRRLKSTRRMEDSSPSQRNCQPNERV